MLKVKISGYYKAGKDRKNYNGIEALLPDCPQEVVLGNVINRVVPTLFDDYTERGKCHVDKVTKDARIKPSYDGKNIKDLDDKDIQQLAVAYNLVDVPLYHQCSLFDARRKAYRAYCNAEKGMNLDVDFDFEVADDFVLGKKKDDSEE